MRLLIVDDDASFRSELCELLVDEGFEATAVGGGADALELLESSPFDVLLTDLRMPQMSGIDLLRRVQERHPEIYPVMLTGYSTAETAVQALAAGAFDYVPKPFRIEQLSTVLRHLEQERAFRRRWSELETHPSEVVAALARTGKELTVFVWGGESYVGAHVVSLPESAPAEEGTLREELLRIEELVHAHVDRLSTPMVLLERVDRLFDRGDDAAVLEFLERTEAECRAKGGRLLATIRPGSLALPESRALLRALRVCFTPEMNNSLASPVRRLLVVRLAHGPATLTDLGRTEGIEDVGKAFFHLQKLLRGGLVEESRDRYALTEVGSRAAEFLRETSEASEAREPFPGLLLQAG